MTDFFSEINNVLTIEAQAILAGIQNQKPEELEKAVQVMLDCKGKIVLIGVGKSGIIAHKIAATMTSTGTTAISLSASDCMHGDLGAIHSQDVVIAISNSGETEEILAILPHLKLRKNQIIAIVGNINSTLADAGYAVINASVDKEACPLNLAPTTSTTLALALGDALAMTLMKAKGISSEDFAINHPSGKLGKRLALRVLDLMNADILPIHPESSWNEIIEAITNGKFGAIVITDWNNQMLGIITDGDIRRVIQKNVNLNTLVAEDIMTKNPISITQETLAYDALQIMEKGSSQISVLPVIDGENKYLGLIRIHDIIGKL
jgi:arabinose-5-phosphate isomerase